MESKVFLMDCMEGMKEYPDKWFDLALVDPPYRDENQPTKDMRKNGSMKYIIGRPDTEYFNELYRISKNQIIWGANNFQLPQFKGFIVWKKKTIGITFTMSMCEIASLSENLGTTSKWIEIEPQDKHRIHPTQKPVKLYEWIYKNYLPEGGKVIDTHLGSGSNRIAAWNAGNVDFTGYEIDEEYYQAAEKRFQEHIRQLKIF